MGSTPTPTPTPTSLPPRWEYRVVQEGAKLFAAVSLEAAPSHELGSYEPWTVPDLPYHRQAEVVARLKVGSCFTTTQRVVADGTSWVRLGDKGGAESRSPILKL